MLRHLKLLNSLKSQFFLPFLLFINLLVGPLFIALAIAVEPICPGGSSPNPNVIWCDDFEDGTWLDTWDASPYCCDQNGDGRITVAEMNGVTCGNFGYMDNCAAWNRQYGYDGFGYDGHYADKSFTSQGLTELYIRWYVYVSNPFIWATVCDKNLIINDAAKTIGPYVALSMWGEGKPRVIVYQNEGFTCVRQDPNECVNRPQNKGVDLTLQPGKWYLFEWYFKLNTPGVKDGIMKLWIDEAVPGLTSQTLRMEYNDVVFRRSGDTGKVMARIWLSAYHQTNPPAQGQHQKWDNIVISKGPIGPIGTTDKTPPMPPTGLRIIR